MNTTSPGAVPAQGQPQDERWLANAEAQARKALHGDGFDFSAQALLDLIAALRDSQALVAALRGSLEVVGIRMVDDDEHAPGCTRCIVCEYSVRKQNECIQAALAPAAPAARPAGEGV